MSVTLPTQVTLLVHGPDCEDPTLKFSLLLSATQTSACVSDYHPPVVVLPRQCLRLGIRPLSLSPCFSLFLHFLPLRLSAR